MMEILGRRPAGTTSLLYLTSGAGEGKTSVINYAAVQQAKNYKNKNKDWLLVPVPLGGRPFLRFDDLVISALANRLRFQWLYYDAFLELVRLGVIVPAFDGFEEMIAQASSKEAIKALANLINQLESSGSILVAARKAYFEYADLGIQSRLRDEVKLKCEVGFAGLSLKRWNQDVFEDYAKNRGVESPRKLFLLAKKYLGGDKHPVLTRAVLVKRLVDVDIAAGTEEFLKRIGRDQGDYFYDFVEGIVERESTLKWVDTSGASSGSILSTEEHHELLAMIAEEMWITGTAELRNDIVEFVVELFAEERINNPAYVRQIKTRIMQHALLTVPSNNRRNPVSFDHEDFRVFYLGQAIGRALIHAKAADVSLRMLLDRGSLPQPSIKEAARHIHRDGRVLRRDVLEVLQDLADHSIQTSFIRENCGALSLALIDNGVNECEIHKMSFPADSLGFKTLNSLTVSHSYFHATSLTNTRLIRCRFVNCEFERIEIDGSETVTHSTLDEACRVDSLVRSKDGSKDSIQSFSPGHIRRILGHVGFEVLREKTITISPEGDPSAESLDPDPDLALTQRFLRGFWQSTSLHESTVRTRLGTNFPNFVKNILPRLKDVGLVETIPQVHGSRIRLATKMRQINEALKDSRGSFAVFLEELQDHQLVH